MIALKLAKVKGTISQSDYRLHLRELELIPSNVEMALQKNNDIEEIADYLKTLLTFYIWVEVIISQ